MATRYAVVRPRQTVDELHRGRDRVPPGARALRPSDHQQDFAHGRPATASASKPPDLPRKAVAHGGACLGRPVAAPRAIPAGGPGLRRPPPISTCSPASTPRCIPGVLAALALGLGGRAWWMFRGLPGPAVTRQPPPGAATAASPHRPWRHLRIAWPPPGRSHGAAMWDAHRQREVKRLAGLGNWPAPSRAGELDGRALRLVPVLLLALGLVAIAGGWLTGLVAAACLHASLPPPPPVRRSSGSRRRPTPASRRSISTSPDTARQAPRCRSAASWPASSMTCADASRRCSRSTERTPNSPRSAKGKYQVEQVGAEGQQSRPPRRRAATSRRAGSCTSSPIWRRPSISRARFQSTLVDAGRLRRSDDFGVKRRSSRSGLHGSVLGDEAVSETTRSRKSCASICRSPPSAWPRSYDTFVRDLTSASVGRSEGTMRALCRRRDWPGRS